MPPSPKQDTGLPASATTRPRAWRLEEWDRYVGPAGDTLALSMTVVARPGETTGRVARRASYRAHRIREFAEQLAREEAAEAQAE